MVGTTAIKLRGMTVPPLSDQGSAWAHYIVKTCARSAEATRGPEGMLPQNLGVSQIGSDAPFRPYRRLESGHFNHGFGIDECEV